MGVCGWANTPRRHSWPSSVGQTPQWPLTKQQTIADILSSLTPHATLLMPLNFPTVFVLAFHDLT